MRPEGEPTPEVCEEEQKSARDHDRNTRAERASFHHLSSDHAQAQLLLYSDALLRASSSDNIDDVFRNKTPNRPGGIHRKLDRSIRSQEKV